MQVIVISESLIIRKGIEGILSKETYVKNIKESHILSEANDSNYDLILIDLNKNNEQYLEDIKKIKHNTDTKIMVLDFYENRSLFSKCMKIGVDGYILANIDSEDIAYAVKQLAKGKKYYDGDFIENYISRENKEYVDELTKREKEILYYIAKGKSNLEISKDLFITEHTVKKHTSNIFSKLKLKDRIHAAIYAYDHELLIL